MGWMVNVTPRPLYTGNDTETIMQEAGWAQGRSGQMRKCRSPLESNSPGRSVVAVTTELTLPKIEIFVILFGEICFQEHPAAAEPSY